MVQVFQQTVTCYLLSSKSICGSEQRGEVNLICHSINTKALGVQEGIAFVSKNIPMLFASEGKCTHKERGLCTHIQLKFCIGVE